MRFISFTIISLLLVSTGMLAQPKIQSVDGVKLDFGSAYQGTKIEKKITIKNTGTDTLHIKSVEAQCGCTATMMSAKSLAPAETGELTITFNTKGYNGRAVKHVYVKSDDPGTPALSIEFEANVITVLMMTPQFISINDAKPDSDYIRTVTLTNPTQNPVKILSVSSKFELVKTTLMKNLLGPGEQTVLQVDFRPKRPGHYEGAIELATDHPASPKVELKVFGWVKE